MSKPVDTLRTLATESCRFMSRHLILLFVAAIAIVAPVVVRQPATVAAAPAVQYFPQTNFVVASPFLDYWQSHGGLAIFGLPKTPARYELDPISNRTYLTQWFERERFEYHPENAGTQYAVLLGLLGRQLTQGRQNEQPFQRVNESSTPNVYYFSQTGHTLGNGFLRYWLDHGGLAVFGYPISQEFAERNPSDGSTYTVQYFERARFEYHPANNPPYDIELGLLGNQLVSLPNTATYFDDRTSSETLIMSFYNAINRHEYDRAFGYFDTSRTNPNEYAAFKAGYANTAVVTASVGTATQDNAAGNTNYRLPVVLRAQQTNGTIQTFQNCYGLHLADPAIQAQPPFKPLAITAAYGVQISNDANVATALSSACASQGSPNTSAATPIPAFAATDISSARYTDDRSSPESVIRSLYNAINRHEYLRAFNYWATAPVSFAQFQQGYATTRSVQLTVGTVTSDAGAGQRYYKVPFALSAVQTNGSTQNYAGCYTLHISEPSIQDTPPFQPLAIRDATVTPVATAQLGTCN